MILRLCKLLFNQRLHCNKLIHSFFEKRVAEYAKSGVMNKTNQKGDEINYILARSPATMNGRWCGLNLFYP